MYAIISQKKYLLILRTMNSKLITTALLLALGGALQAQNVGIGIATPHASAQLEISSTNKGLLIPG